LSSKSRCTAEVTLIELRRPRTFANYQGGLIIIGVTDSDGVATSVDPWDVSEADELRIREIVTERVVPYIDIAIQRVASKDASGGFLLVTVPGSNDAPHAVRVGDKLRYPVRDGRRTRFMAEAEVATSYRRRFTALEERGRRVEEVQSGGVRHLLLDTDPQRPWLTVTLVPLRPVNLNLDVSVRNTIEGQFLGAINVSCPNTPFRGQAFLQQRVGVREVQITDSNMFGGAPRSSFAVLHADGSAFTAAAFWSRSNNFGDGTDVFQISQDFLTTYVLGLMDLACHHAVTSGAGGDALLAVSIALPAGGLGREIVLARDGNFIPPASDWPRLDPSFAESRFTVSPRQIVDSGSELVAASFQVLADLEAAFGEPEPTFVRRDGSMTPQFGSIPALAEWASLRQIELR
jgi:hypothetical protein